MTMRAIVGSVGGGKSYYLCKVIVEALVEKDCDGNYRNRNIVTNLELHEIEVWHQYLSEHHSDWYNQTELDHRLTVIEDNQLGSFWRYRGCDSFGEPIVLPEFEKEAYKENKPDWETLAGRDNGVHYILDEVGRELNARNWRETGFMIFEYSTLHRHLGDDVTWAAQVFRHVDTQFRSLCSEFLYMRNRAKEKWGVFSNYKDFKIYATSEPYHGSKGADATEIMWQDRYTFDQKIGDLYKTSKYGKAADTKVRRRGIPMIWMWIGSISALLAVVSAVWILPDLAINAAIGKGDDDEQTEEEVADAVAINAAEHVKTANDSRIADLELALIEKEKSSRSESQTSSDKVARLLTVKHARPSELATVLGDKFGIDAVSGLSPGSVFLTGEKESVDQVSAIIALADSEPPPMVYCSIVLATVQLTDGEAFSLDWVLNLPKEGPQIEFLSGIARSAEGVGSFGLDAGDFGLVVEAAARSERFTVISRPFVAVESGQTAILSAGREIPIRDTIRDSGSVSTLTSFKEALLKFELHPVVLGDGSISLRVDQSNADVIGVFGDDLVPALATQSFSTTLRLHSGAVVALGGIAVDSIQRERRHPTPFRIPLFGSRSREVKRSEFVILARLSLVAPEHEGRAKPSIDPVQPDFHKEGARVRGFFDSMKNRTPRFRKARSYRRGFFPKRRR